MIRLETFVKKMVFFQSFSVLVESSPRIESFYGGKCTYTLRLLAFIAFRSHAFVGSHFSSCFRILACRSHARALYVYYARASDFASIDHERDSALLLCL